MKRTTCLVGMAIAVAGIWEESLGQPPGGRTQARGPLSAEIEARFQAPQTWDGAGQVRVGEGRFAAGYSASRPEGTLQLQLSSRISVYEVDRAREPWGPEIDAAYETHAMRLFGLRRGTWSVGLGLTVESAVQREADFEDGLSATANVFATRRLSPQLSQGAGLTVTRSFGDDWTVYPTPTLDWRWNDRWRLALERGVSLSRVMGGTRRDTLAFEVAPQFRRYRLRPDSEVPNGIFIHRRVEALLRWDRRWARAVSSRLGAGWAPWEQRVIKDREPRTVWRDNDAGSWFAQVAIVWEGF